MSSFPERLKYLRQSKGVTQKQLSDELKITDRNYRRYEAGITDPATSVTLALAEFFGCSIDYLVGRTDKPEVNK